MHPIGKGTGMQCAFTKQMQAWEVVKCNPGMNVPRSTWAFKCKRFPNGQIKMLKARFCVHGDHQVEGVDCFETFTPVVCWTTIRLMLIDSSSMKKESYGGSKFWLCIVYNYTDYCWRLFLTYKADLKDKMFTLFTDLIIAGIEVKYICCDDSRENKAIYNPCWSNGYLIKFEFSGPRTPQRNGKVERKFQTLYGRICAMLNDAGLENDIRSGVWSECHFPI